MPKKVRLAIVGCGGIANGHMNGYRTLREKGMRNFEITACCDVNEENGMDSPRYVFLTTVLGLICLRSGVGMVFGLLGLIAGSLNIAIFIYVFASCLCELTLAVAMIKWKKWGIWGYTALSFINCFFYYASKAIVPLAFLGLHHTKGKAFAPLVWLGLLYMALFVGKNKAWNKFT